MKNLLSGSVLLLCLLSFNTAWAQSAKEKGLTAITEQAVKGQLEFLSSDWTEGRATGTPGAYMAADYIASIFNIYGLQPGGDIEYTRVSRADRMKGIRPVQYRTFFQSFDLIEYKPGDVQELSLITKTKEGRLSVNLAYKTDFSVRASDVALDVEAPVVFAGYGFRDKEKGYDDYKGLDVKGKIVLCVSGYPGHNDTASAAYKKFGEMSWWSLRRAKGTAASELGAAAIIEVYPKTGNISGWATNYPFRFNTPDYEGDSPRASFYETGMKLPVEELGSDPTRITISKRVLDEILKGTGIDIKAFEGNVKSSLKPDSRELKGKSMHLKTTVDSKIIRARNVVGVIPGKDTNDIIVVGGHYDHLGKHDGWIWNGADDNASGTVGVMTLAKACMAAGEKPEKTIVFCAWTGEEKGLLGSWYFTDHPYNDARIMLNLNYDMISRDNANDTLGVKCTMEYTEKYGILEELAKKHNEEYGLGLDIKYESSERPGGGSDHASFSDRDIPVFYFMAGFPPEYHQPGDHIDLVNFDKMTKIIKVGYLNIWELANSEWE